MSNEQTSNVADWRDELTSSNEAKQLQLKVADKEIKKCTFKNEGVKKHHPEFGDSVVFDVLVDGETEIRKWYVNAKNFDLKKQIKELGTLTGLHVEIRRSGSGKLNTRYFIQKSPLG